MAYPTPADLLFAASGSTFNIVGVSGAKGKGVLNLVLGQSGNFDAVGTINVSAGISDGGNGFGITKIGAGTLAFRAAQPTPIQEQPRLRPANWI